MFSILTSKNLLLSQTLPRCTKEYDKNIPIFVLICTVVVLYCFVMWVCGCVCVCVCVCVYVCMCGFCNVCVCEDFVRCGCFGNIYTVL
jgi:hypothetical protein